MSVQLEAYLAGLERLDLEGLRAEWRRRYGAAPKLRSCDLLRRIIAWRVQAAALGGHALKTKQALRKGAGLRANLPSGARLTREWQGVAHDVEVVEGGYRYGDIVYASLSEVAREITGVRWNGPRFFGLRKDATPA